MAFVKKAGKSHGEQFAFSDWATRIKRAKINNVQRSQENVLSLLPPHTTNNHRLPKLDLPHFYGDVLERISFWDSYESTIHCNNTLTPIQKFGYLKARGYCRTNHSRIRTAIDSDLYEQRQMNKQAAHDQMLAVARAKEMRCYRRWTE